MYSIAHAQIDFSGKTTYKNHALVRCNVGFELKGPGYITCLSDGQWSSNSSCQIKSKLALRWQVLPGISLRYKVRKRATIRNRYNQEPHLNQDTNGKVTTSQLDITNESQEASSFPAGDHKASINRQAQKHNKNKTEII